MCARARIHLEGFCQGRTPERGIMKKLLKGMIITLAVMFAVFTFASCGQAVERHPVGDVSSVKKVMLGMYPQKRVTDENVIATLDNASFGSDNRYTDPATDISYEKVTVVMDKKEDNSAAQEQNDGSRVFSKKARFSDGELIKETTYYFEVSPIEWYVLGSGETKLLVSVNILDGSVFSDKNETDNDGNYPNNWTLSVLRDFLNGETETYADKAFGNLSGGIGKTLVVSSTEAFEGFRHAKAIPNVWDKAFALSYKQTVTADYGFNEDGGEYDRLRMAAVTDYARAKGVWFYMANDPDNADQAELDGNGNYWLRTVGHSLEYAAVVRYTGAVGKLDAHVKNATLGVRPAISFIPSAN